VKLAELLIRPLPKEHVDHVRLINTANRLLNQLHRRYRPKRGTEPGVEKLNWG